MKSCILFALVLAVSAGSLRAQRKPDLTDARQKISYAFGLDIISTLTQQGVDVDIKALAAGMADTLAGNAALAPEEKKEVMKALSQAMAAAAESRRKTQGLANLEAGRAFLAANARQEGVQLVPVTAPDGSQSQLQYIVLKAGEAGPSPRETDIVEVHYQGALLDGTVFDSSIRRGIAPTFGVKDVMPGWNAALQKMKKGDKWRLFIPASLGFGDAGPPQAGPNSTLIYELELISFYTPSPATK